MADSKSSKHRQIKLLIIDDSLMFRKFLRELLSDSSAITIAAEAASGAEGADFLSTFQPDVVLLDMEMPMLDGMAVLRHLMIHRPTPTIMLSSISQEGTARCFDALKNGAVDFLGKDQLHPGKGLESLKKELVYRILRAAKVKVQAQSLVGGDSDREALAQPPAMRIIFCEDCGARNIIDSDTASQPDKIACRECGDLLDAITITKYRRVSYIGVLGAGRGSAGNLLNIVSKLPQEMSGALIVLLNDAYEHIDSFTRYLKAFSSLNVLRLSDGMNIEGGNCYIASADDHFHMVAHSTNYTIRRTTLEAGQGPFDLLLISIASIVKNRMLSLVLSGERLDGVRGFQRVKQSGGMALVLNSASCLCKEMGENILKKCPVDNIVDEGDCIKLLVEFQELINQATGIDAVGRTG